MRFSEAVDLPCHLTALQLFELSGKALALLESADTKGLDEDLEKLRVSWRDAWTELGNAMIREQANSRRNVGEIRVARWSSRS